MKGDKRLLRMWQCGVASVSLDQFLVNDACGRLVPQDAGQMGVAIRRHESTGTYERDRGQMFQLIA